MPKLTHGLAAVALAVVGALGCGPTRATKTPVARQYAAPAAAREAASLAGRERVAAFVWARDKDAVYTFTVGADGEVLAKHEGIMLMTTHGFSRLRSTTAAIPSTPCEFDEEGMPTTKVGAKPAPGHATVVSVMASTGGLEPITATKSGTDLVHEAEVVASAGPYVFLRQSTRQRNCGGHPYLSTKLSAYDVESGIEVRFDPTASELSELRKKAARAFAGRPDPDVYDEPEVTATRATWNDGRLAVRYQMSGVTCEGCGDGAYSSYTRSVDLDAPAMHAELAQHAEAPPAVKALLAAHPELKLGGFTRPRTS